MLPDQSNPSVSRRPRELRIYSVQHAAHVEAAGHPCIRVDCFDVEDRARFVFDTDAEAVYDHYRATLDRLKQRERAVRGRFIDSESGS